MLKLYNTYSRTVEEFTPISAPKAGMYCCGPTVYDFQHIGNLRTYVFEDILKRVLKFNGIDVFHVMNITDVGHLTSDEDEGPDKMEQSAAKSGKSVWELAEKYASVFFEDCEKLNIIPPDVICKATDYIPQQIELIQCLEAKDYTYITKDGVYYDTSKFPDYPKLARLDIKGMQEGKRIAFSSEKRNITDFALWKFSPKDAKRQMEWESPWGTGFPGWHIECSAMAKHFLGNHFDIHCGGIDHIPVHHTNEIAQSEACTGEKYVNYWLHGEFLDMGDEKMSKSLGNFITLHTLIDKGYSPMHYRYFLLNANYRTKLKFSFEGLDSAKNGYENLKKKIQSLLPLINDEGSNETDENYIGRFKEKINEDMNMPSALAVIWEMMKDNSIPGDVKYNTLLKMDYVCGLGFANITAEKSDFQIPDEIVKLAEDRAAAKKSKDFKKADELRSLVEEKGYKIIDKKEGMEILPL